MNKFEKKALAKRAYKALVKMAEGTSASSVKPRPMGVAGAPVGTDPVYVRNSLGGKDIPITSPDDQYRGPLLPGKSSPEQIAFHNYIHRNDGLFNRAINYFFDPWNPQKGSTPEERGSNRARNDRWDNLINYYKQNGWPVDEAIYDYTIPQHRKF